MSQIYLHTRVLRPRSFKFIHILIVLRRFITLVIDVLWYCSSVNNERQVLSNDVYFLYLTLIETPRPPLKVHL